MEGLIDFAKGEKILLDVVEYNYYIINITNINPKYQWCRHK
jgi:hypothetical protein